jgi:predicted ester cyclase
MSVDIATKVVGRLYRVFTSSDLDELEQLFASGFVDHVSGSTGVEGLRQRLGKFRAAFPHARIAVGYVIAQGHYIACRITVTGLPSDGPASEVTAVELLRADDDGRIAERWGGLDTDWMVSQSASHGEEKVNGR